jgi:hypothetical protein
MLVELKNVVEDHLPLRRRSYIWFAINKPELLGAKIAATRWLLKAIPKVKSVREYMGGIGLQSLLVREHFKPTRHIISDINEECVAHLKRMGFAASCEDARKSMLEPDSSELKMVDFPASSILHIRDNVQFHALFASHPRAVVWTDTSISYHIAVHGARYAKALGVKALTSAEDYVRAYSEWLNRQFGYTIARAATRGRNALYLCAVPRACEVEFKTFALADHREEFKCVIID